MNPKEPGASVVIIPCYGLVISSWQLIAKTGPSPHARACLANRSHVDMRPVRPTIAVRSNKVLHGHHANPLTARILFRVLDEDWDIA